MIINSCWSFFSLYVSSSSIFFFYFILNFKCVIYLHHQLRNFQQLTNYISQHINKKPCGCNNFSQWKFKETKNNNFAFVLEKYDTIFLFIEILQFTTIAKILTYLYWLVYIFTMYFRKMNDSFSRKWCGQG